MIWLKRNSAPILMVIAAAAIVIGAMEVVDALTTSTPLAPEASDEAGFEGIAVLAGLMKVTLFLVVSIAATLAVRRRSRR